MMCWRRRRRLAKLSSHILLYTKFLSNELQSLSHIFSPVPFLTRSQFVRDDGNGTLIPFTGPDKDTNASKVASFRRLFDQMAWNMIALIAADNANCCLAPPVDDPNGGHAPPPVVA
jgi:hypothetical protein